MTRYLLLTATAIWVLVIALRKAPTIGSKIGAALALIAGLAPAVWVVAAHGVSTRLVFGYAVIVFMASVLLKWGLFLGVFSKFIRPRLGPLTGSLAHGALSSACEIGCALFALAYLLPGLSAWQAFGFGAGAAAIEAVVTVIADVHKGLPGGEAVLDHLAQIDAGPAWLAALVPFVERLIATADHIACRGLVAAGLTLNLAWPIALAFAAFIATDGFAAYCLHAGWKFGNPAVAARMYAGLALVAVSVTSTWIWLQF